MIQETSLTAYRNDVIPTIRRRQDEVLIALGHRDNFTIAELSVYLNWPVNSITGRLDELEKVGAIEVIGGRNNPEKRRCSITGRKAMQWRTLQQQVMTF